MRNFELRVLCKYAVLKNTRRGEYALCSLNGLDSDNLRQCVGNVFYSSGHSSSESYVDKEKMKSCQFRGE